MQTVLTATFISIGALYSTQNQAHMRPYIMKHWEHTGVVISYNFAYFCNLLL
jgi:hypothetical protein